MASLDNFAAWLKQSGYILHEGVHVVHTDELGYHVVSDQAIIPETVVCKIPAEMILSVANSDISKDIIESGIDGWNALALVIMREFSKTDSKWKPYFDVLPMTLYLPVFWEAVCLSKTQKIKKAKVISAATKYFTGTMLLDKAEAMLETWKEQFEPVKDFVDGSMDKFEKVHVSFESYKRIIAIISAYSFSDVVNSTIVTADSDSESDSESEIEITALVPFADTFNHCAENNVKLKCNVDSYEMTCCSNVLQNSQMFNTYGVLSNEELLLKYGFVLLNNPNDEVRIGFSELVLPILEKNSPLNKNQFEKRLDFLDSSGLLNFTTDDEVDIPPKLFIDGEFVYRCKKFELLPSVILLLLCSKESFDTIVKESGVTVNENDEESDSEESIIKPSQIFGWVKENMDIVIRENMSEIIKSRLSLYESDDIIDDKEAYDACLQGKKHSLVGRVESFKQIGFLIRSSQKKVLHYLLDQYADSKN